ncbi:hypothetical protein E2C01_059149 [Portunus trituberculatus]|uniref:Uncharacterized protein n=1 Tax=Portunus trituberculatus TaxID=210409 RepID=A0A5B7H617_PORTR|nr:hypothetical protein [Portunus trituberculatus]
MLSHTRLDSSTIVLFPAPESKPLMNISLSGGVRVTEDTNPPRKTQGRRLSWGYNSKHRVGLFRHVQRTSGGIKNTSGRSCTSTTNTSANHVSPGGNNKTSSLFSMYVV